MRPDDLVTVLALVLAPLVTERFAAKRVASPSPTVDAGCGVETLPSDPDWILPDDPTDRARLYSWCQAVGPPAHHVPIESGLPATVDSLAVMVWNTNVGAGQVGRLLQDLRSGAHTGGEPVEDFVLLLQEVHREGPEVPMAPSREASWAGRIGGSSEPDGRSENAERIDVVELARREGLHLFYVPSMRNGSPHDGSAPEDRGNAILSTLPLNDLAAIELPVERQRRVAVVAAVEGRSSAGVPWKLRFVSAHLENRARWARLHRALGAAQSNQARALVAGLERLSPVPASAVGGDFNTWFRGGDSGALDALRVRYPSIEVHPEGETRDLPLFLPGLRLDHLFLRLPRRWSGHYEILADRYGSDHLPLLGWVRIGT
jgi:endonuclease/exonuclease/phosphatase family metal-dependent hydrolase